ncbi:MAG: N-acetylmuramoyl-L-alanine amidase [Hyphomicrobium sp.]
MTIRLIDRPDSPLVADLHPSPNIEPRNRGLTATILILHYTGLPTVAKSIEVLSRPDCKVSCHYVIDDDGRITQMVAEEMRAWHAGLSFWGGETDINSASIGIEIQNPGHAKGYPDFPAIQMQAVTALCRDILARHPIPPERVLAHSDVAPERKVDPGEKFDWPGLARLGIGHWVAPEPVDPADPGLGPGCESSRIAAAQDLLARYGYGIAPTGTFDPAFGFVLRAFQLHFRPARVDQRLDRSTFATLERLVAGLPQPPVA